MTENISTVGWGGGKCHTITSLITVNSESSAHNWAGHFTLFEVREIALHWLQYNLTCPFIKTNLAVGLFHSAQLSLSDVAKHGVVCPGEVFGSFEIYRPIDQIEYQEWQRE